MEFDLKKTPKDQLLIQIFRIVQRVPYRITPFDEKEYACRETVTANLEQGDARHKSKMLYNLLMQTNFEAYKVKTIFDWCDLPIPKEILSILKKSTTRQVHDVIEVKLSRHIKSYIDPTWNPELERLGFPITKEWDGKGSTKQITNNKLEYFDADNFNPEDHGIKTDKEEYEEFSKVLNKWLEKSHNMHVTPKFS